jgi:methylphosphotriester-DNA--protein-cysteine methyltransferase
MIAHLDIENPVLFQNLKAGKIKFAGNSGLKIYGTLHCTSGKRMKRKNRVFFASINEAISYNYRPCGHCMRLAYKHWKNGLI